jgi:hypothetical protein
MGSNTIKIKKAMEVIGVGNNDKKDSEFIPLEIRFITCKCKKKDLLIEYKKKYLEEKKEENKILGTFRYYGWYDYVIIIKNPLLNNRQETDKYYEPIGCLDSSVLGWYLSKIDDDEIDKTDPTNIRPHYYKMVRCIKVWLDQLCKKSESCYKSPMELINNNHNIYLLSLISLNDKYKITDPNAIKEQIKKTSRDDSCIEGYTIIHCVGLWDLIVLVGIDNFESIERYKRCFLLPMESPVRRSSTMILVKDNNLKNK